MLVAWETQVVARDEVYQLRDEMAAVMGKYDTVCDANAQLRWVWLPFSTCNLCQLIAFRPTWVAAPGNYVKISSLNLSTPSQGQITKKCWSTKRVHNYSSSLAIQVMMSSYVPGQE